ncbi:hypothetical protein VSVS12_03730 [Vibrio scophthalmi]|uniref:tyrosine-type recombinase/integrase n=1 Tax=Vibrio scophthalmi TaxID=45658 RepID=UPI0008094C90|nr:tyrosine-type recombinase/integrase [Vibrio scophthalmi]ANS87430.1 hypothetical protein VSVS12_03730 [Vibrio scophthalmi]
MLGVDIREANRKKRLNTLNEKANSLIDTFCSEPEKITNEQAFNSCWEKMMSELDILAKNDFELKSIYNILIKKINQFRKTYAWTYPTPRYNVVYREPTQLMTHFWLSYAWQAQKIYYAWMTALKKQTYLDDAENLHQSLILSLMFHSGHCNYQVVKSFIRHIASNPLVIQKWANTPYIVFQLDTSLRNTNAIIDEVGVTEYHCYLHPLTITLLRKWSMTDMEEWEAPKSEKHLLNHVIKGFCSVDELDRRSFRVFCSSTAYTCHNIGESHVNHALLNVQIGKISTYGLPSTNIPRLIHGMVNKLDACTFGALTKDIKRNRKTREPVVNISREYINGVKSCFKSDGKEKLSDEKVLLNLKALSGSPDLTEHEMVLVDWLVHKTGTCGPSTLKGYFGLLGKKWLQLNVDVDILSAPSEVIQEYYQELIGDLEHNIDYTVARLKDFHHFLVDQHNVAPVSNSVFPASQFRMHTRSGFVDESLFKALLQQIDALSDLSRVEKTALKTICIVAYRTGLRPAEIRKAQWKNWEPSHVGWLDVRENKYGNNKSPNSLRKVPLFRLLLPSEQKVMDEYLRDKKTQEPSEDSLLFTFRDPYQPFDTSEVSVVVGKLLRKLSGLDHLVLYHLRHSCFSRMQLIAELDEELEGYPNLCQYSEIQRKTIRSTIFETSRQNIYYSLAQFAGHESPGTTFSHYLHFSDWIIATKLAKRKIELTLRQAMNTGAASRRAFKEAQNDAFNADVRAFANYINKKAQVKDIKPTIKKRIDTDSKQTSRAEQDIDLSLCRAVLEKYAIGFTITALADEFRLAQDIINSWIKNANIIKELTTNVKSKSTRNISNERLASLTPPALRTASERKLSVNVVKKFSSLNSKEKKAVWKSIDYALQNTSRSKTGIRFTEPKLLTQFIRTLEFAIPKDQWRAMTLFIENSEIRRQWEKALENITCIAEVTSSTSPRKRKGNTGAVRLELRHPNDKEIVAKSKAMTKYSSNALMYTFHLMAIMRV